MIVEVEWWRVATGTLTFVDEDLLAAQFALGGPCRVKPSSCRVELGRWREVQHVLKLRHMADLNPIEYVHAFLDCMNLIAIEVGGTLLELCEVLNRTQA